MNNKKLHLLIFLLWSTISTASSLGFWAYHFNDQGEVFLVGDDLHKLESKKKIIKIEGVSTQSVTFLSNSCSGLSNFNTTVSSTLLKSGHQLYIGAEKLSIETKQVENLRQLRSSSEKCTPVYYNQHGVYQYTDGGLEFIETRGKPKLVPGQNTMQFVRLEQLQAEQLKAESIFLFDQEHVYYKNVLHENNQYKPLAGADRATFQELQNYYAKDKNRVYFFARNRELTNPIVEGADQDSFSESPHMFFGQDKKHLYYRGKQTVAINGQYFKLLSTYYAKDNKHVYQVNEDVTTNKRHL